MAYIEYMEQKMILKLDDLKNPIYSSLSVINEIKTDDINIKNKLEFIKNKLKSTFNHFHNFKYYYYFKNNIQTFEDKIKINTKDFISDLYENYKLENINIPKIIINKCKLFPDIFYYRENVLIRLINNLNNYAINNTNKSKLIEFTHSKDLDTNILNQLKHQVNNIYDFLAIQIYDTDTNNAIRHKNDAINNKMIKLQPNQLYDDINLNMCSIISHLSNIHIFYNPQRNHSLMLFKTDYDYENNQKTIKFEVKYSNNTSDNNPYPKENSSTSYHICNPVILVEDDINIMKMNQKLCNKLDIKYISFYDGIDAKEYITNIFNQSCKSCRSELTILSDQIMPKMKGMDLFTWLQGENKKYNYKIKFVLVTANEDIYEGPDQVIFKPLTIRKLRDFKEKYYVE